MSALELRNNRLAEKLIKALNSRHYDAYYCKSKEELLNKTRELIPEESTYSEIKRVITTLPLKTLEETSCYSMEYATYGILALAWIDIENLEEYPENGRMTLKFGFSKDKVESLLDSQSWKFEN